MEKNRKTFAKKFFGWRKIHLSRRSNENEPGAGRDEGADVIHDREETVLRATRVVDGDPAVHCNQEWREGEKR